MEFATSWMGTPQKGCRSVSVSHRRTPTDQTSLSASRHRRRAAQGRCSQGSRHVPDRRERVGAVELRESEVEKADGELVAVLDEDVGGFTSRWTIPAR
jgi:hypothetical protein